MAVGFKYGHNQTKNLEEKMNFGSVLTFRVDSTVDARKVYLIGTCYILWPSFENFWAQLLCKILFMSGIFPSNCYNEMKDYFKM